MIWRLVRIDGAWTVALLLIPVGVAGGLWLSQDLRSVTMPFLAAAAIMVQPHQRATLFTAALPVPARKVFVARVCAVGATWWLPVIAAIVTLTALGRPGAGQIAAQALAVTAWVLIPLSIRPREFSTPWLPYLIWVVGASITAITAGFLLPPLTAAASICVASLLFWRTWRAIPASFQSAPLELSSPEVRAKRGIAPAIAWWPVARSVFMPMLLFWPVALLGVQAPDQWLYVTLFACLPVGTALMRSHWALTLPIHRGRFLAAILAWGALPLVAGYVVRLLSLGRLSWGNIPMNGAGVLAAFLLISNGILIGMHHRFRRLPRSVRVLCYVAAAVAIRFGPLRAGPAWEGLAPAILAASTLLFWTATRLFRGIEILNPRYVTMWDSMSQK